MQNDQEFYSTKRPRLMPDESSTPVPYNEGPIWRKHASRLLESLHLLREQKASTPAGTPEAAPAQPKIETPASIGGGEMKG